MLVWSNSNVTSVDRKLLNKGVYRCKQLYIKKCAIFKNLLAQARINTKNKPQLNH